MSLFCIALALFQDENSTSAAMARALMEVREKVVKSVVAIEVDRESDPEGRTGSGPSSTHKDYYNRPSGPTSGTVIDEEGYILTSYFNVSGKIRRIVVTAWDGVEQEAELLGFDQSRDVALLKIDRKDLSPLSMAKEYRQGDFVVIVGRSPDKRLPTLNHGILSATTRQKGTAVQTDAELNYGNVGAPLVNLKGALIGVTSHIRPREPWGQSGGVGFATKISEIQKILPDLKEKKQILEAKQPFLGVAPGEGSAEVEGVEVGQIIPGSPAEKAALHVGDFIIEFDGTKVTQFDDLRQKILEKRVGDEVKLKIKRKNGATWEEKELKVTLEERSGGP
jgi:S1-C subfamily serine protease